jgi:two-component system CheB/CheR fusion protein
MTNEDADETDRSSGQRTKPTLVVGLGASAGGIEALRTFFANVPEQTGAAYVVILHLSPDYESHLAQVLQVASRIPVTQVTGPTPIAPDHVYVISPAEALIVNDGVVRVVEAKSPAERRAPVDIFFRTLADAYRTHAVAVVLSGTGPNGSNGLKRVKEFGGLAIAQDPAEAEFADMPHNAIATGLVDHVMPVASIPPRIADYGRRIGAGPVQPLVDPAVGDHDTAGDDESIGQMRAAQEWRDVLTLLRVRTGQDFSNYKAATIRRRVERRLNVRGLATLAEYAELMRNDPQEPQLLMRELLISVTNFFRDPEAFAQLERRVIPALFVRKSSGDQVRVWSAGCATGEEAYSLAILLAEYVGKIDDPPTVQVFATDLDEHAIAVAREGLYTDADVADLSRDRLQRFFHREAGGYRVRRDLRETVLFAHHNAIKDPPFSHLDLISCRNLLIYLNRPIQERLIETFHFALRPGGYLFLGTSEAADAAADLFVPADKDAHIFESRMVMSRLSLPLALDRALPVVPAGLSRPSEPRSQPERISPGELHLRLLEQYAPPSLVVNEEYTLLHVSQSAGPYLQIGGGEPSREVLRLVRPELRADLRTALHLAMQERSPIEINGVRSTVGGVDRLVRITVKPVLRDEAPPRGYFLIQFDTNEAPASGSQPEARQFTSPAEPEARQLAEELSRVKGQLRATIEQDETHAEEARAANEELQAMNEELRSAAEELETSKEELQSVNEELTTVNQELKIKIEELGLTNNDFQNLINSTDIAAIFLDRSLRVKLSTPRAQDVFNLLPTDIGRKLSDITTRIVYDPLHEDILQVLDRLQTIEREVQTRDGRWYLMRILPYRTTDDRIDGVALTFDDITARRQAEAQLRASEERFRLLIDSAVDYAIFTMTAGGRVDSWNSGAERLFGYTADEIIGHDVAVLFTPEDRDGGVPAAELNTAREKGRASDERWHVRKDGSRFYCSGVTTPIAGTDAFAKIARDLTERRQAEVARDKANQELERRVIQRTSELQDEVSRGAAARDHITSLLRRVVTAQEDERARIARDLHDQLGQQLTALRLTLERHRAECSAAGSDMEKALELTQSIDTEVDFLAWELRPAALDDLGLAVALPRFLDEWSAHYGIAAEFRGPSSIAGMLPAATEIMFYRVAQEALNNVVKHAHASRVDVLLERRDRSVVLVIDDDGVGFDPGSREVAERGLGIAGMRERAELVGASLQLESSPGNGTTVFVRCPVGEGAAGAAT